MQELQDKEESTANKNGYFNDTFHEENSNLKNLFTNFIFQNEFKNYHTSSNSFFNYNVTQEKNNENKELNCDCSEGKMNSEISGQCKIIKNFSLTSETLKNPTSNNSEHSDPRLCKNNELNIIDQNKESIEDLILKQQKQKIFVISKIKKPKNWTPEEDKALIKLAFLHKQKSWSKVAKEFSNKTPAQCRARFKRIRPGILKGPWSHEEDILIITLVQKLGKNWSQISKEMKTRNGKQIRDRFLNYLDSNINKNKFSDEEDGKIVFYYKQCGPKWSLISQFFDGRTGDMIKNRFHSCLRRKVHVNEVLKTKRKINRRLKLKINKNKNTKKKEIKEYHDEIFIEENSFDKNLGNLKPINVLKESNLSPFVQEKENGKIDFLENKINSINLTKFKNTNLTNDFVMNECFEEICSEKEKNCKNFNNNNTPQLINTDCYSFYNRNLIFNNNENNLILKNLKCNNGKNEINDIEKFKIKKNEQYCKNEKITTEKIKNEDNIILNRFIHHNSSLIKNKRRADQNMISSDLKNDEEQIKSKYATNLYENSENIFNKTVNKKKYENKENLKNIANLNILSQKFNCENKFDLNLNEDIRIPSNDFSFKNPIKNQEELINFELLKNPLEITESKHCRKLILNLDKNNVKCDEINNNSKINLFKEKKISNLPIFNNQTRFLNEKKIQNIDQIDYNSKKKYITSSNDKLSYKEDNSKILSLESHLFSDTNISNVNFKNKNSNIKTSQFQILKDLNNLASYAKNLNEKIELDDHHVKNLSSDINNILSSKNNCLNDLSKLRNKELHNLKNISFSNVDSNKNNIKDDFIELINNDSLNQIYNLNNSECQKLYNSMPQPQIQNDLKNQDYKSDKSIKITENFISHKNLDYEFNQYLMNLINYLYLGNFYDYNDANILSKFNGYSAKRYMDLFEHFSKINGNNKSLNNNHHFQNKDFSYIKNKMFNDKNIKSYFIDVSLINKIINLQNNFNSNIKFTYMLMLENIKNYLNENQ